MPAAKKFGTFNGVFTPAILTILGVIMYLRLPLIVGQAGLYSAVGIVLIAHIISVTTGLSVSSIATDKRVKTGGTYYMISRSLGLPIGGTLGLALFVGLSFSVSLYLIGFSESFLGFWGIEATTNNIRLSGSIALLVVTIITFISTSLALKTQFFILLAIILSLGSIFLGKSPAIPQAPLLEPIANATPFIVLFGVFFPAVTGFEAGVSMSGDLENPKKSIPIGTISAIVVGLLVYIGMSVFLAYRVSADQLANNPNILLDISIFPPFVLAGIWGATLSSALGSILGAPRILQAISIDKITPRFFSIGFGKENEPRNALLLTFLIAEGGILVGELDVIARVVSMFFITTYGFLNLSCAIENWASPDFRPDFRVSKLVSLAGSVTCLIVMIQLDLKAMIAATAVLLILFFYLKRRELTLESGDTWEGIWSSVIRSGLDYLNKGNLQQRNWRPNIILFSGGTSARPHLISLGTRLVDKRGILSSFDLIEVDGSKTLYKKSEQSIKQTNGSTRGHYARRVSCDNVYEAMETISKYYGFSGLEPNTVLMGWGKNSQRPDKFVHTIKTISELDYNLLLLSYDESRGFGNYKQIDIWWRGKGNMISFAASLCRFLSSSDDWHHAKIRFLMITDHTSLVERLHQVINQVIDDFRVEASVKIINNAVDKKPFYDIIKSESREADLIINGIPDIPDGEANIYVEKTNTIIESLGTVLLIRGSTFFEDSYSHLFREAEAPIPELMPVGSAKDDRLLEISFPEGPTTAIKRLASLLTVVEQHFENEYLAKLQQTIDIPISIFQTVFTSSLEVIEKQFPTNERIKNQRLMTRLLGDMLFQLQKRYGDHLAEASNFRKDLMTEAINWVVSRVDSIPGGLPETIEIPRSDTLLKPVYGDRFRIRLDKVIKRLQRRLFKKQAKSVIRFKTLVKMHLETTFRDQWLEYFNKYVVQGLQSYTELQGTIDKIVDSYGMIKQLLSTKTDLSMDEIMLELDNNRNASEKLMKSSTSRWQDSAKCFTLPTSQVITKLMDDLSQYDSHLVLKNKQNSKKSILKQLEKLEEIPEIWFVNHQLMMKTVVADLTLLTIKNRFFTIVRRVKSEVWTDIEHKLVDDVTCLKTELKNLGTGEISIEGFKNATISCLRKSSRTQQTWHHLAGEIRALVNDLPESMETVRQESLHSISEQVIQAFESVEIPLRRKVEFFIESSFLGPMADETNQVFAKLEKTKNEALDVMRLLSVGLAGASDSAEDSPGVFESLEVIIKDSLERLDETLKVVHQTRSDFEQLVDRAMGDTLESINLYSLAISPDIAAKSLQAQKGLKVTRFFHTKWQSTVAKIENFSTNLLYRQSRTAEYSDDTLEKGIPESVVEHLLDCVDSVSPNSGVLSALPFYYKHLFLGKPAITKDFWVGRSMELTRAIKAVRRFKEGNSGALAIIGEPGSGKSALCQMIASRYFEKQKIWFLPPPESGSADEEYFESRLKETLEMAPSDSLQSFSWPKNSVLVIDDIGRWWHRRQHGFQVIMRIINLIREKGDQCMFIINANTATFKLINELLELESYLLDIIPCKAMGIKELKKIVNVRHHSAGLNFMLGGKTEEELSGWAQARFFTKCFSDCSGNIGQALKKWIRCIESVSKEKIKLKLSENPKLHGLGFLNNDQLMLLAQLQLHTQLSLTDLSMICKIEPELLDADLQLLQRGGLLKITRNDVIELNLFTKDILYNHLQDMGLL